MPLHSAEMREEFEPEHVYIFLTNPCIMCGGEQREIKVPASAMFRYRRGEFVQKAFSDMPVGDREHLFLSGIGPACFEEIFDEEEGEEDEVQQD